MIEALVLPIIEKVLSSYISAYMGRRSAEKTRAEMITAIKREIDSSVGEVRGEVETLETAVRELNLVVKTDSRLDWRKKDDALIVSPPRLAWGPPSRATKLLLEGLHRSVDERREALEIGSSEDRSCEVVPQTPQIPEVEPEPELRLVPHDSTAENPEVESSWRSRVLSLQGEAASERRRSAKERE